MKYKCFDKDDRQELCTEIKCSSASVYVTSDIPSLRMWLALILLLVRFTV